MTKEHLHAKSRGGGGADNVVPACFRCNNFVGSWPVAMKREFRKLLEERGWRDLPGVGFNGKGDKRFVLAILFDRCKDRLKSKDRRRFAKFAASMEDWLSVHRRQREQQRQQDRQVEQAWGAP